MSEIKVNKINKEKNIIRINRDYNIRSLASYKDVNIVLDSEFLNINTCLFGKNEKETKSIQKDNYKKIKLAYKKTTKLIKFLKKNNINFHNSIYYDTDKISNNNDKMLEFMINLKSIKNPIKKLEEQISFTCDYLDGEMKMNNNCQFENGKCIKYRNSGEISSCCKADCKYGFPCSIKNIACKIFMCDFLRTRGYVFYVKYMFSLKKNLTLIDREICKSCLFVPLRKVLRIMLIERILVAVLFVFILVLFAVNLIKFI